MLDSLDTTPVAVHTSTGQRPLRIVGYHPRYADETVALAKRMHSESTYAHTPFDETAVARFLSYVDDKQLAVFLAVHSQRGVVGFYAISNTPTIFMHRSTANELALYVVPEMRHTKAFLGLMARAERWAKAQGAYSLICGASGTLDPDKATRAHLRLGYKRTGVVLLKEFG